MAKKPKAQSQEASLARLTPNSLSLNVDGQEIRVALDKQENALLNIVLAAQVRSFMQATIKRYKEADSLLTPKELRDIAGAFSDLAKASGEIYVGNEELSGARSKKEVPDVEDYSFDVTPKNEQVPDKDPDSRETPIDSGSDEGPPKAA